MRRACGHRPDITPGQLVLEDAEHCYNILDPRSYR